MLFRSASFHKCTQEFQRLVRKDVIQSSPAFKKVEDQMKLCQRQTVACFRDWDWQQDRWYPRQMLPALPRDWEHLFCLDTEALQRLQRLTHPGA